MTAAQGSDPPPRESAAGPLPFEFGAAENQVFEDLAKKMEFVGFATMLVGGLLFLYGLLAALQHGSTALLVDIGAGVLIAAIGIWTRRAGVEFQLVAETHGKDISHVLAALTNLHRLYVAQYWILLVALIFFVLVIVFGFMARTAL